MLSKLNVAMSGASHPTLNNNNKDKHVEKMQKHSNNLNKINSSSNHENNVGARKQPQGEKIQSLKNQIEKQMKQYAKQEEYEEMLKLIKVKRFLEKMSYYLNISS